MRIWLKELELSRWYAKRDSHVREVTRQSSAPDDIKSAWLKWNREIGTLSEEIEAERSARLIRTATKLDIPHPVSATPDQVYWTQGVYSSNIYYLNVDGRTLLRASIRREQRERHERLIWWIPVVFGLIGSVTGLVSVFGR